jgi:hypothetical protein
MNEAPRGEELAAPPEIVDLVEKAKYAKFVIDNN